MSLDVSKKNYTKLTKKSCVFGFFVFCVLFLGIWAYTQAPGDINYVEIAGVKLKTDVVSSLEEKEKGLSGRNELKEDESMLFVFDSAGRHSFWMKDMNFPIDIIWIGEDLRVVYIKKNALPTSYPEIFTPNKDTKYVLEAVSSFSKKNNLKEGDEVEFSSF